MNRCQSTDHGHECRNEAKWHISPLGPCAWFLRPHNCCEQCKKIWKSQCGSDNLAISRIIEKAEAIHEPS
jgi:hypothetical protein